MVPQLTSPSGTLALGWAPRNVGSGALTFALTANANCAAVGFATTYGAMSPATVWAVQPSSDGTPVLAQFVNVAGHEASTSVALSPDSALLSSALSSSGALSANFTVRASSEVVNLIWATCSGTSVRHGGRLGTDYGFAAINTSCTPTPADPGGALCILKSCSSAPDMSRLDIIAGAGAAATCAVVLVSAALHRWGWTARRVRWPPAAPTDGQMLLLIGWMASLSAVAATSAAMFPASPAHALGRLLAPAWAASLVPVTPRGVLATLGWSFHEAVTAHRVAAATALALTLAHVACALSEVGPSAVRLHPSPTVGGHGYIYGAAAFAAAGAAAVVALPPVLRATGFAAFKAMHGTFASLALVLACFHATCLVPYLALPIACGAFDRLFAWARASSEHKCKVTALSQGTAVRLQVDSVRWRQRVQPGQWAYVKLENPLLPHVPGHAIAASLPSGWHPLSIVSVPASASGGAESCGPVTFVAAGSAFAMAAAAAATATKGATPQSCFARVDGPYGRSAMPRAVAARLRSLLIVAGGAGITPCLPCAFDMASHLGRGLTAHTASNAACLLPPPTVALLWAVRRSDALSTWFPGVLERLAAAGVSVTCAVTGEVDDTDSQLHDLTAAGVTLLRGRPDVGAAVRQAVASNASTSAVFVCGPSSLTIAVETAAAAEGVPCYAECFTA